MTQPLLPGMPRAKTRVRITDSSPVEQIVEYYSALRGRVVHRGKARKHAKAMLDAGYKLDEIRGCILWMHEHELYGSWTWTLAFAGAKLPEYQRETEGFSVCTAPVIVPPTGWRR